MLDDLEKKIKKEIESGRVKPRGRYFFLFKKILFWTLALAFLLLAGMSLAVLALIARYGDWDIYHFLGMSPSFFFLRAFPYVWLLGVAGFLFASFYRLRRADGAYTRPFIYHGLAGFCAILVFAIIFYFSGLGQKTETWLANNEFYRQVNYLRSSWDNPEKGLLAGNLEFSSEGLKLYDFNKQAWSLILPTEDFNGQYLLLSKDKVKLIGKIVDSSSFLVEEVRPWECGCPRCIHSDVPCHGCSGDTCGSSSFCGMHN
jgi:hypothetical protein